MNIACLFPGQGAQTPGFLSRLPAHPEVARTLREAGEVLGADAAAIDSEASLAGTLGVQLSGLIAGVAVVRALTALGVHADAVAGLSSGAFTAAVACGTLSFEQALPLVRLRAQAMQQAYPRGHGLAALVGLDESQVGRLVAGIHSPATPLYIANLNARTQIVLAGSDAALERALSAARQMGARHTQRMAVSVPSHCELMAPVADTLHRALAALPLQRPRVPYISNVNARALRDAEGIREDLASNVAHTVRWHDGMTVLYERGIRTFFEVPPGATLTGILRESFDDVRVRAIADTPFETIIYLAQRAGEAS
ncbi:MAG: malonate decarboxylase subunit epsilon [Janthinobacterium lividum]